MSFRQMRRIQPKGAFDLTVQLKSVIDQPSDAEDDLESSHEAATNPFDLLNQQSSDDEENVPEEEDDEQQSAVAATSAAADKKKKKKRNKKKKTNVEQQSVGQDKKANTKKVKEEQDIDAIIKEFLPKTSTEADKRAINTAKIIPIELKNLNPENEVRHKFGTTATKTKANRTRRILKATRIVTPKDSWLPPIKNLMTMKAVPPRPFAPTSQFGYNPQWFEYEHSKQYQDIHRQFLDILERRDSDQLLINMIKDQPQHVESLIQLSEMCKMTENYSLAADLIERAVYALEISFHPSFSLTSGNSRLDYRSQTNRSLFIVLFKHAQFLESRACCRTALEVAKLTFNLNPDEDPLALLLVLDFYAIRCKQYYWLTQFYEALEPSRNLSQLPNMAYSYALAYFLLGKDIERADELLQYALLMFPGALRLLLQELSVETDRRVFSYNYFSTDICRSQSPALHQLIALYVLRAKIIWHEKHILSWLERNVNMVIDRIDRKDPIIEDYAQKRARRYGKPPRAVLRHVMLADMKERVPLAPFILSERAPLYAYDPLPPAVSINTYERRTPRTTESSTSAVTAFYRSFLPTFEYLLAEDEMPAQAPPPEAVAANEAADIAPAVGPMNRTLERLRELQLSAMNFRWTAELPGIPDELRRDRVNDPVGEGSTGANNAADNGNGANENSSNGGTNSGTS